MTHLRLFRRNNKQSFSVQLSPTSGVVEIHCASGGVVVDKPCKVDDLERRLMKLGREEFGCIGGFSDEFCGEWRVQLVKLGPFDIKARGFVQCKIQFTHVATDDGHRHKKSDQKVAHRPTTTTTTGTITPTAAPRRKTALKWAPTVSAPHEA